MSRTTSTPGVSVGTMIIEIPWRGCTSGFVTHINSKKSATDPCDVNHLCPLITHSSPSRTACVAINVGSAPAPGSVIENALRIFPSSSGYSHFSFCSSLFEPSAMSSAFPESGALFPNTCGP